MLLPLAPNSAEATELAALLTVALICASDKAVSVRSPASVNRELAMYACTSAGCSVPIPVPSSASSVLNNRFWVAQPTVLNASTTPTPVSPVVVERQQRGVDQRRVLGFQRQAAHGGRQVAVRGVGVGLAQHRVGHRRSVARHHRARPECTPARGFRHALARGQDRRLLQRLTQDLRRRHRRVVDRRRDLADRTSLRTIIAPTPIASEPEMFSPVGTTLVVVSSSQSGEPA
jgi:hypothetical protein